MHEDNAGFFDVSMRPIPTISREMPGKLT